MTNHPDPLPTIADKLKAARYSLDDAVWEGDTDDEKRLQAEIKRLENLQEAGQLYDPDF